MTGGETVTYTTGGSGVGYTTGGYTTGGYTTGGYVTGGSGVRQGQTVTYTTGGSQYLSGGSGVNGSAALGDVVTYTTNQYVR